MFQTQVNSLFPDTRETFHGDILLWESREGYLSADILLPEKPDKEAQALLKQLNHTLEKLPQTPLTFLYTSDGRFLAGRYLKATYKKGKWDFYDYLYHDLTID